MGLFNFLFKKKQTSDEFADWEFSEHPIVNFTEIDLYDNRSVDQMFQEVLDRLDCIEEKINQLKD